MDAQSLRTVRNRLMMAAHEMPNCGPVTKYVVQVLSHGWEEWGDVAGAYYDTEAQARTSRQDIAGYGWVDASRIIKRTVEITETVVEDASAS